MKLGYLLNGSEPEMRDMPEFFGLQVVARERTSRDASAIDRPNRTAKITIVRPLPQGSDEHDRITSSIGLSTSSIGLSTDSQSSPPCDRRPFKRKMKKITRRWFLKLAGGMGTLGLAASYPVFVERYTVLTNTYRIPVPNLPEAFAGFRIVHLTDLHYGLLVPLSLIWSVVTETNRIDRDAVVCTGDYVHQKRATDQIDAVWPILSELHAPAGVFSVLGNHDHWADTARSRHWLAETEQDLSHRVRSIARGKSRLWFAGAGDLWMDHRDLDGLLGEIPETDCRIVLAHNPDTADTTFASRVDLMLSGHTHGGQIDIPFVGTPVLPVRNKTYSHGLKTSSRGFPIFISRGIGWSKYPIRFNCYPEIAVLELVPGE